ncbi:MAG: hypothetical protein IPM08_14695 [Actinomycetales bacterium]|nr:hypothetical protein [Actinomycetales bacterium]
MRRIIGTTVALLLLTFSLSPSAAAGEVDVLGVAVNGEGTVARVTEEKTAQLAQGKDLHGQVVATPMEYRVELACPVLNAPQTDAACQRAVAGCQVNGQQIGSGFLYDIFARPRGSTQPWVNVGSTCFAAQVPGAAPTVTLAMLRDAMHNTPWATASISTQPVGDVTLVGLKTFYRVNWSSQGYEPGEVEAIDPARMLGRRVEIRPKVDHFTYVFGDGATFGPTRSPGGVYPNGDITHAYPQTGSYAVRVDTTFTADFRVDGGPWTVIPETVTVTGPVTTVTVKAARAVLVN